MTALLLWLFFWGHVPKPQCPDLRPEVVPVYVPLDRLVEWNKEHGLRPPVWVSGNMMMFSFATVTTDWNGSNQRVQVGTTTSQENIEYNKRVQECRTRNGEF